MEVLGVALGRGECAPQDQGVPWGMWHHGDSEAQPVSAPVGNQGCGQREQEAKGLQRAQGQGALLSCTPWEGPGTRP